MNILKVRVNQKKKIGFPLFKVKHKEQENII